jgi:hypothetical protein
MRNAIDHSKLSQALTLDMTLGYLSPSFNMQSSRNGTRVKARRISGNRRIVYRIDYLLPLVQFVVVNFFSKCGSDGGRTFTYDFSDVKLHERQEIIDPILRPAHRTSQGRYLMPLTQIPEEQWEGLARRNANGESLRQLARVYGVSHEAIRQIVKRVGTKVQ